MINRKTILVVEDSPTQAQELEYVLSQQDYEVLYTKNGRLALKLLETKKPDLVITDVVMPEMGGYELCKAIKSDESTKQIPVILLTSLTDSTEVVKALECGADSFVTKPYEADQFLTQIQQILNNSPAGNALNDQDSIEIHFAGNKYVIQSNRRQILTLLLSTFDSAVNKNSKLLEAQSALRKLNKQLEEKVVERTAKVHQQAALLDISPDAIFVCDSAHLIILWNKGAELIYGWKAEEVMGRNYQEFLFKDDPDFSEILSELKVGKPLTHESVQMTKENKSILIEGRYSIVKSLGFQSNSILVVHRDVSEKKALEERYFRAQRIQGLGSLSSGIAHDLNNVLTPILLIADVLKSSNNIPDKAKELLGRIEMNANRGARMIQQILTFARGGSSGRYALDFEKHVLEVVRVATDSFPKSIETVFDCENGLNPLMGDSTQLYQVLLNLCINSRDAMPKGGKLTVRARNFEMDEPFSKQFPEAAPGSYVLVEAQDTGDGIPLEKLGKIFDPFFTTKDPGKGTGLGLATVQAIVKSHGGFVDVSSQVGVGTLFKVYLPALVGSGLTEPQETLKEAPDGQGELILVADNEASVRDIISLTLETYGYRVISATDGGEASAIYAQKRSEIRVCIIDMNMPVLDGEATVQALVNTNPEVKIIAMSGIQEDDKSVKDLGLRVKGFLAKPFASDAMLQLVHNVMEKK